RMPPSAQAIASVRPTSPPPTTISSAWLSCVAPPRVMWAKVAAWRAIVQRVQGHMAKEHFRGAERFTADFGKTAEDYARHRAGYPDWLFERLMRRGLVRPGMQALDLATGTGYLARGLAQRGLVVTGLDIAPEM